MHVAITKFRFSVVDGISYYNLVDISRVAHTQQFTVYSSNNNAIYVRFNSILCISVEQIRATMYEGNYIEYDFT